MAMQVASLSMGGGAIIAAPHELQREKRAPLPMEQKTDSGEIKAALPGSQKSESADLRQTTLDLEQISLTFDRRLKFVIDQESREITIKVIDNETDKVIKVLPPEELQRLHSKIKETMGFLFDRMV
jgi:flagellar protein FlaG